MNTAEQNRLVILFTRASAFAEAALQMIAAGDLTGAERAGKLAKAELDDAVISVCAVQDGKEIL